MIRRPPRSTLFPHDALPISLEEAGMDPATLDGAVRWLNYTVETELLMNDIEESTSRITTLLGAAKQYSDRKSTRLNSSHLVISYAVFCLKKQQSPQYRWR